ncbi:helix-turn-helix transcriptional regulator [Pseudomonas thivervalensis]|uniref:helix-turn-helix transcriptional regulator n=1 Tax=Pseudomonas thivervalensis TaxID=86265 RepID=UPI003D98D0FC
MQSVCLPVLRSTVQRLQQHFYNLSRVEWQVEMDKAPVTSRPSPFRAKPQGGWQGAKHQATVARVVTLLQAHEERPIRLSELCRNASISERTLRSIFKEVFGMGPNRYLHVRRLHLVRAALSIANANIESVSDIALRFGFSDSGRMASDYHALFGEYPSQTLMRMLP